MEIWHGRSGEEIDIQAGTCLTTSPTAAAQYAALMSGGAQTVWTCQIDTDGITVEHADIDCSDIDEIGPAAYTGTADIIVIADSVPGRPDIRCEGWIVITAAGAAAITVTAATRVDGWVAVDDDDETIGWAGTEAEAEAMIPTDEDGDAEGFAMTAWDRYMEQVD